MNQIDFLPMHYRLTQARRTRVVREVLLLAGYGAVAAYCYGFLVNLSFWPFSLDPQSAIAYRPGASLSVNVHHYLIFDATTSLGWDTGRAVTTAVCILLVGPALLATFRRASRRAAFQAPTEFTAPVGPGRATAPPGAPATGYRPDPDRTAVVGTATGPEAAG